MATQLDPSHTDGLSKLRTAIESISDPWAEGAAAANGAIAGGSSSSSSAGGPARSAQQQQQVQDWTPSQQRLLVLAGTLDKVMNGESMEEALQAISEATRANSHANNPVGWWCFMYEWVMWSLLAWLIRIQGWAAGEQGGGRT